MFPYTRLKVCQNSFFSKFAVVFVPQHMEEYP
jgi:hypothetical protein